MADLIIDFINDPSYQRLTPKGKNELLAKAVGLPKGLVDVWDATAGLARDAIMLARLGCRVRAVERNEQIYHLLESAQKKTLDNEKWNLILQRVEFICGDSVKLLTELKKVSHPQVIYLDPMFSDTEKKSALPNKQMQIFRQILKNEPQNFSELFEVSRKVAKDRIVIKMPIKSQPLTTEGWIHSFKGKSVRYDLYRPV